MFYGVYPSMFSSDASTSPYWETPAWYNAGRPLFKRYIPMIRKLSAAGWEPITYARTGSPKLYVERYGGEYLTLFNDSAKPITCSLDVDVRRILGHVADKTDLVDAMTDTRIGRILGNSGQVSVDVQPQRCVVVKLVPVTD